MGSFITGDTGPDLTGTIHALGDATDVETLTGATVRFQMRKDNDKSYRVNGSATIINATSGTVRYQWSVNDLNLKGSYKGRWEVTYPGGRVVTTAAKDIVVDRQ